MGSTAHGRILFWEGASLWILKAPEGQGYPKTSVHSHHAVQLTLSLRGRIDFESGKQRLGGVAIAVAPDAPHTFQGTEMVAHLFVAPAGRCAACSRARRSFRSRRPATFPHGCVTASRIHDTPTR